MDRRTVIAALAGCGFGLVASAQAPGRTYRVGYLGYTATNTAYDERMLAALRQRLRELGFVEGRNLVIEWRYAEGKVERYPELAAELVRLNTDVVLLGNTPAARAVMAASPSLPIVVFALGDPVKLGLASSLARPGGRLTGIVNF